MSIAYEPSCPIHRPGRIELELTDAAKRHLVKTGYDPVYGARPLKRVIQRELQNPLAEAILKGAIKDGEAVGVTATGEDHLAIAPKPAKGKARAQAAE